MESKRLQRILNALQRGLEDVLGERLDAILLYGSQARREAHEGSDIDVLIILKDEFDYGEMLRLTSKTISSLSLENDVVISRAFVSRTQYENSKMPFLINVRRENIAI